ncbi:MAG: site-specific DNA-methyltransferase [Spirochaetaceae bacterium]|jgi:site-specific DNA-methyltransferase (adenine-specific)|nr:site-specific DNA-methyltransferase [Spirochaetaceae bacterium]
MENQHALHQRAPRNRTLTVSPEEEPIYRERLLNITGPVTSADIEGRIINGDIEQIAGFLPEAFIDLLIADPPYNLTKNFNGREFRERSDGEYAEYLESWFVKLLRLLKKTASIYVCCDWKSSPAVYQVLNRYAIIRNRITWQREKGRGAGANWKNCVEDIWFATPGREYYFNTGAVMVRRKVIAPYRAGGIPKGWEETEEGNFRLTHPSNFWDDISVPYWSMPENTDHPTQKPEKLMAKLILASSAPGDFVFDPFLGSGTTSVTAKKLGRRYSGVEVNTEYCIWAEKRLRRAEEDRSIQGYRDGIFWERNSAPRARARKADGGPPDKRGGTEGGNIQE